ncbi:uncharacterized protein LOC118823835 [Colossoma macropomum]|uniref:uncharacterized protein LOC118823835 n=1 Tax=Colossoma macropomum TaxID=42526 RepID=UPI001863DED2|nr:uncharacterized protein LOC118823835 [Colossoma macropomum]
MAESDRLLLRVFIATDIAHKMLLPTRPTSVQELITIMREKFKPHLDFDFNLQYEDPDFGGQLCVLSDITELPQKAVAKVFRSESDTSSTGTSDTELLPHALARVQTWPDVFPLPLFSYDVEYVLEAGNTAYQNTGKTLKLTRAQKHDILENMAKTMHTFEAYPSDNSALRLESQICAEFHRITNMNLQSKFYAELDKHSPRQKAARTGKTAEAMRSIFTAFDVLTEQEDEPDIADLAVALLSVVNEDPSSLVQFSPVRIAIVLEGDIVLNEGPNLADAFLMMFGLMYALHLDYPKELTHTFNFIQKVLMGLDDFKPLSPRLLNLKNDLLVKV